MILNQTIEHTLENGLKVLFYTHAGTASATFMIWYKAGARNEKHGKTGLAHFLEHLSFKKTEFFENGQIVAEITRNGGLFNAYTSRDFTCYYENFASNKLELAMIIESQRMNKIIFDEDTREKEVGIILSELERSLDDPYKILEEEVRKIAYPHHPYRNPVIGIDEDIKSISLDDLNDYYKKFYVPNNATVVVVGNFDQNFALDLIKKHFGSIPPGEVENYIPPDSPQSKFKRITVKKEGTSSIIKLAYHIPPCNNEDIFPLIVLGETMNLGISSRIYQSLVETQIATDIDVNVEITKDPGLFTIVSTLFPHINPGRAERKIMNEINEFADGKFIDEYELKKTKRRIKSSFEFNKEGTFKLAYLLGYYETVNSHKFIDNYVESIEKVTADDIKRVAGKYLIPSNCSAGYFIPTDKAAKKASSGYDYVPHETINHIYTSPPILINEKDFIAPVEFSKKILDNGIKILVSENKTSDTVKLFGTINAGNLYSATVNPVMPVMCAGMLNRGSKGLSKMQIAEEIEARGASVGISNVSESVNFSVSSTSYDFPYVMEILAKILTEPSFPEEEYNKYEKLALAGIIQKQDHLKYIANTAFSQMIYPKNHIFYTHSLKKQEEMVKNITLDDIKDFYENYYSPNSVILGISGNINAEEVFNLVNTCLGSWQPKKVPEPLIKPASLQKKYKEKIINIKGKSEAEVIFGHYGNLARKSPDFHRAVIMNFILGGSGSLSSRIGKRIREDLGLVYNISSGFTSLLAAGAWSVKFGIDPQHADLAIENLKDEIIRFIEHGITDSEFDFAKSYLTGSYPLRFTSNSGIARALLINEFYDLGDSYLNEYQNIITAITKEEVNDAARKYLHPELASVVKAGSFN